VRLCVTEVFVNIIVFDKNYKLLDAAWEAVDPAAHQVGVSPVIAHDFVMREYTAKEEGYVFMYVSNENATLVDVYFSLSRPCGNDVVMTHTKSNVIQYNEYYPFGMNTANSWTRENTTGNNFLYNAGSELNKTTSNYEMFFREYDPALGRMTSVDPVAGKYSSLTPYNYAFNDPVTYNDPLGDDASDRNYGKFLYFNSPADFSPQDAHAGPRGGGMFGDAWDYETYGGNYTKYGPGNTGFRDSFIGERLKIGVIKKAIRLLTESSKSTRAIKKNNGPIVWGKRTVRAPDGTRYKQPFIKREKKRWREDRAQIFLDFSIKALGNLAASNAELDYVKEHGPKGNADFNNLYGWGDNNRTRIKGYHKTKSGFLIDRGTNSTVLGHNFHGGGFDKYSRNPVYFNYDQDYEGVITGFWTTDNLSDYGAVANFKGGPAIILGSMGESLVEDVPMVSSKRLKYIVLIITLATSSYVSFGGCINGSYAISALPSSGYPVLFEFQEKGRVVLKYFNGRNLVVWYRCTKKRIVIDVGGNLMIFNSIKLNGERRFLSEDYPNIFLIPTDFLRSQNQVSDFVSKESIIGTWKNESSIKQKKYFEFLERKFIYTNLDSITQVSNVYLWEFRIIDGLPIILCRFPSLKTFYINHFDRDSFSALIQVDKYLEVSLFERVEIMDQPALDFLMKKWGCIDCDIQLPVEMNIGLKFGLKFSGELDLTYYNWYSSVIGRVVLFTGPDNSRPIYPSYFKYDFDNQNSRLIIDFGGAKGTFKIIR
jgi:RHS repeat-associated protein